jgi:Uma2 family endonuclease
MSAMTVGVDQSWARLLRTWESFDVPEGWRAEISDGGITMVPPPGGGHNETDYLIARQLMRSVPDDWRVYHTAGLTIERIGALYIPDLAVMPAEAFPTGSSSVNASRALLVVEITSSGNADHDRKKKLWGYAHAPVPLYMLVDAHDERGPHCTLYSDPAQGDYRRSARTPFGEPVTLPDPFDLALDTSEFPAAAS